VLIGEALMVIPYFVKTRDAVRPSAITLILSRNAPGESIPGMPVHSAVLNVGAVPDGWRNATQRSAIWNALS
jgi:hypothetical protein